MSNPRRTKAFALAGFLVAMFGFWLTAIPSVMATPPPPSGGQINFFDAFGGVCTSTPWNGGTYMDGNQGFGGNLGTSQHVPIIANGEQICIEVVFTNQSPGTYTISGDFLTLVSGSNPFTTDSGGNADVFMVFSVSGLSGNCVTHPIKVSPGISGGDGSSGQIHHDYGGAGACGGTTPPPPHGVSVPEFPLGSAGFVSVMAAGITAMLLLRRRQLAI